MHISGGIYTRYIINGCRDSPVCIAARCELDGPRIDSAGVRFSMTSITTPRLTQPRVRRVRGISREWSGRSMVLTTHHLLVPDCEWVGAIPPTPICFAQSCHRVNFTLASLLMARRHTSLSSSHSRKFVCATHIRRPVVDVQSLANMQ
jgi:hypothetical protein